MAEKGEFTRRAFTGGRIDLTQVEAVLDIISAKTELFSSVAAYNLSGQLSILINNIRILLISLLAHIEASIDFPDEVDEMSYVELNNNLINILNTVKTVLNKASDGNILKHGVKIVIVGKPNVGKSSLFNYLLNSERAIVTNIPGTTRDILQEYIDIEGIPAILTDTAGIRETQQLNNNDLIEHIGVNRSKSALNESDLILFTYDSTQGLCKDDKDILRDAEKNATPILLLANKSDLKKALNIDPDSIRVSAVTGEGIHELKEKIKETVLGDSFKINKDEVYINMRHRECLTKAIYHIQLAINAVKREEMQDLISIDIKAALISLNEIVGETITEEIIDHIFSQFCIGK